MYRRALLEQLVDCNRESGESGRRGINEHERARQREPKRKQGEMMKPFKLLATGLALLAILLGVTDVANASSNRGYRGFATCSTFTPDPDRQCFVGDGFGATFIAKKRDRVRYALCVTAKASGAKDCFSKRTSRAGRPSSIWLFSKSIAEDIGTYRLKWRVHGKGIVARATLEVLVGD